MRRSKGSLRNKTGSLRDQACHAVDLCDFQSFFKVHGREEARDTLGEHGFPASGRPHEKYFMIPGYGDLQSSFSRLLAADLGKIRILLL